MPVSHYIVFVGASPKLATELLKLESRLVGVSLVAPAEKKKAVGITAGSAAQTLKKFSEVLALHDQPTQPARLSVWAYQPDHYDDVRILLQAFGHSAWIELLPKSLLHKVSQSREYIEHKVTTVIPLLNEVSKATYSQRRSAPLSLPLRNFKSKITDKLKTWWYNDLDLPQVAKAIKSLKSEYAQRKVSSAGGFVDDRSFVFSPAKNNECHGVPHPIGSDPKAYTCGRFRYGVALFSGFHYDVTAEKSDIINKDFKISDGSERAVSREKRKYINIFPNDHILPEK